MAGKFTAEELRTMAEAYNDPAAQAERDAQAVAFGIEGIRRHCVPIAQKGGRQTLIDLPSCCQHMEAAVIEKLVQAGFVVENPTNGRFTLKW